MKIAKWRKTYLKEEKEDIMIVISENDFMTEVKHIDNNNYETVFNKDIKIISEIPDNTNKETIIKNFKFI